MTRRRSNLTRRHRMSMRIRIYQMRIYLIRRCLKRVIKRKPTKKTPRSVIRRTDKWRRRNHSKRRNQC